jgi:ABC-type Fe3+/spermidine/putrescine transport system ATPase subunit
MIEFRGVAAAIGSFQLQNIDLAIQSGHCHVIVGPTGAGKTFLLETLLGLRPLNTGTILLDGADITALPPHQRNISYVPQDACLFPNLTVRDNIWYGVRVRKIPPASVSAFVEQLIAFFSIAPLLDRYPRNLSGGEKQRVALVRALAPQPALLVLDEPFSSIDYSMREDIRRLLKELLERFATTTLIVTHDLDEAFFLGQEVSILIEGRLAQSGGREDVYYYPKTLPVATFLGIKNRFHGRVETVAPGEVKLFWEELGKPITVSCKCSQKRFKPGQNIEFGIRSEAVSILRPGRDHEITNCVFEGVVKKLYMRGRMHTVLLSIKNSHEFSIEIDIHDAAARKIGIQEGAVLRVHLNPKWIFLLSAPPA